jgi:hypothetical protein
LWGYVGRFSCRECRALGVGVCGGACTRVQ